MKSNKILLFFFTIIISTLIIADDKSNADISEDMSADTYEDIDADISEDMNADTYEDIDADISEDMSADTYEDIDADISEDMSADISEDMSADTYEDIDADISEDMNADISEDMSADTYEDIDADISEDMNADISEDMSADTYEDIDADISEDMSAEISEDMSADTYEDIDADISEDMSADTYEDIDADMSEDMNADTSEETYSDTPVVKREIKSTRFFGIDGKTLSKVIIQPAVLYGKVELKDEITNELLATEYEFLVASATADYQLKKHRAFALKAGKNNPANTDNCTSLDKRANCAMKELLEYRASEGINLIIDSGDNIGTYYEYNCKYQNTHSDNSGSLNSESLLDCKYVNKLKLPSRVLFYDPNGNSSDIISIFSYFAFRKKYKSEPPIDLFDHLPPTSYYMYDTNFTAKEYNQYVKSILSLNADNHWQTKVDQKEKEKEKEEEYMDNKSKVEADLKATKFNLQECYEKNENHEKNNSDLIEELNNLKKALKSC